MKYRTSLTTKITLVFVFTFILLIGAFINIHKIQAFHAHKSVTKYHENISDNLHKLRLPPYEVIEYLKNRNFTVIEHKSAREIMNNVKKPIIRRRGFETISIKNDYYFHFMTPHFKLLFKDNIHKLERSYLHIFVFVVVVSLFITIYLLIMKNIKDTNLLLSSRQLFLRTVMHELKTPIAKGRIVSEMLEEEKQKDILITVFEKLKFLIIDFAKVEEVVSKNYTANMGQYSMETVIKNSVDSLMLDNTDNIILENLSTKKLTVDLELISMALKNLLDNGLKYSNDNKVIIKESENEIQIISKGDILPKPLKEYFKPFHNDTHSKNHGMGLGLYIVKSILDIHNFRFEYEHKDNENIFKVVL